MTYIARNFPESIKSSEYEKTITNQSNKASFFDELSPKSAMFVGLVTSVLVICSIGFIILLTLYFKSGI